MSFGPAGRSILITAPVQLLASVLLIVVGAMLLRTATHANLGLVLVMLGIAAVLIVLAVQGVFRQAQQFAIDGRVVSSVRGVLRRDNVHVLLEQVQSVECRRSLLQRLFGLGTVVVSSAGNGQAVVWRHIARPREYAAVVLDRVEALRQLPRPTVLVNTEASSSAYPQRAVPGVENTRVMNRGSSVPIIGLVGGIGAGKSTVAKAFERAGCLVIDSDARAKAALDRPEVRAALVQWWGGRPQGILDAAGRVDRSKVAAIVFNEPAERSRLEQLVHPIVRQDRAQIVSEAVGRSGVLGIIVDAPLLFEAGVDKECDAVVFVDAPEEVRRQRVAATRGWSDQELARREAAQLSLEEKRSRSQFVVMNAGDLQSLDVQASRILESLRGSPRGP